MQLAGADAARALPDQADDRQPLADRGRPPVRERARRGPLDRGQAHYPVVSSHNGTGGTWSPSELRRLYKLGGFAAVTPDTAPKLARKILTMARYDSPARLRRRRTRNRYQRFQRASRSAPGRGAPPAALSVPVLRRQRHLRARAHRHADVRPQQGRRRAVRADRRPDRGHGAHEDGRRALPLLFNSAQAYVDMWRGAFRHK